MVPYLKQTTLRILACGSQVVMEMSRRCQKQMTRRQGNCQKPMIADLGLKMGDYPKLRPCVKTGKITVNPWM